MGHEYTATDAMFSVREMPWMGLLDGQVHVLGEYPTREEAQAIAHPWEPIQEPVFRQVPYFDEEGQPAVRYEELTDYRLNARSDNGNALGVTSDTIGTVTNGELYDLGEALQKGDTSGNVMFETGGSLQGGKKVWLMLRLNEPLRIKGDPHGAAIPFYALQNDHVGNGSLRGQATKVRIICGNTSHAADMDSQARGTEFRFRHTSGIQARIEEAKAALAGWRASIDDWKRLNEALVEMTVTDEGVTGFLERFIPAPISTMTSERVKRNIDRARGEWMGVYNSVTCEGIQNTAYGLVQASSEWSEHVRRANNAETRFKRAVLDHNSILGDAVELAREAAHA